MSMLQDPYPFGDLDPDVVVADEDHALDAVIPVLGRVAALAALAVFLLIGGCAEHVTRSDTVAPWAGDALAANAAVQTVDPWPREAGERRLAHDGQKAVAKYRAYRDGPPATSTAAPSISITAAPPPASTQ